MTAVKLLDGRYRVDNRVFLSADEAIAYDGATRDRALLEGTIQ